MCHVLADKLVRAHASRPQDTIGILYTLTQAATVAFAAAAKQQQQWQQTVNWVLHSICFLIIIFGWLPSPDFNHFDRFELRKFARIRFRGKIEKCTKRLRFPLWYILGKFFRIPKKLGEFIIRIVSFAIRLEHVVCSKRIFENCFEFVSGFILPARNANQITMRMLCGDNADTVLVAERRRLLSSWDTRTRYTSEKESAKEKSDINKVALWRRTRVPNNN